MKLISPAVVLAAALSVGMLAFGCSSADTSAAIDEDGSIGSVRVDLQLGEVTVTSATVVLSGGGGFLTQTRTIDISDDAGVVPIFFGGLPVGRDYRAQITAGSCSGSSTFEVFADQTTVADVTLDCGNGSGEAGCEHIAEIVSVPALREGMGLVTNVELVLDPDVTPTSIIWLASSSNGGAGTIVGVEGDTDRQVSVECTASGSVELVARVTALEGPTPCLDQGGVSIECVNREVGPTCGDGLINQSNEQCDGTAFPPLAHPNSLCSASCQLLTVICTCGDGLICPFEEQCDGSSLPASAPAGTTCSLTCMLVSPPLPDACGTCAEANCALQRASIDSSFAAVAPILDCVLGPTWEAGGRASEDSCANNDLLSCYCGTVAGEDCVDREPASLDGPCVDQVLTGTACASSSCVAPIFLNPANANGKAMQYAQCQQDFCYEVCFNP